MKTKKLYAAFVMNLAVVLMELGAITMSWKRNGVGLFTFYTEDSNIFALIACFVYVVFLGRYMLKNRKIPTWVTELKYIAACCLTLTFLVVIFVLAPSEGGIKGYRLMLLTGPMLFTHLLCPVVTVVSCLFMDEGNLNKKNAPKHALIPTILYAATTVILNLCGLLIGPYPFLRVYNQPWFVSVLWCIGIIGGAYLINNFIWVFRI